MSFDDQDPQIEDNAAPAGASNTSRRTGIYLLIAGVLMLVALLALAY